MDNDATVFWLHSQLGLFVVQEHSKQSRKVASPLTQVHNTVIKNAVKIYTHQSSRSEQIDCVPGVIAQKILRMCNWIFECDTSPERDASVPMTGLTNNMTDDEYLLLAKCNFIPLAFGARFYIVNGIGVSSQAQLLIPNCYHFEKWLGTYIDICLETTNTYRWQFSQQ